MESKMKIMTWNIKHGGSKGKLKDILLNIIEHNADIVVLTEYRVENGKEISQSLRDRGWNYQLSSNPPLKTNGIFIASKREICNTAIDYKLPEASHRWLDVILKGVELNELGWTDAWRFKNTSLREYTWYSKAGNGFRLDYAYLSPKLKNGLINVFHSHQERIRELSDHSSLRIELNPF